MIDRKEHLLPEHNQIINDANADIPDTKGERKKNLAYYIQSARQIANARLKLWKSTYLGPRVRLSGSPFVTNQGRFVVGNRTVIASHVTKVEFNIFEDATLEIGESCIINYGSVFLCTKSIKIGNNCMIGLYSIIMDNDMHGYELENRLIRPEGDEIIIEDNVWLGARVTVLKGVTIGEGSIIAAGSVVTKSIPPRTIAGGVPARVLKDL